MNILKKINYHQFVQIDLINLVIKLHNNTNKKILNFFYVLKWHLNIKIVWLKITIKEVYQN